MDSQVRGEQRQHCFHCHEVIPAGLTLSITYNNTCQWLCCHGCQAVAQLIIDGGQGDYYRFREGPAARPNLEKDPSRWTAFDPSTPVDGSGLGQLSLWVEGIHCGACSWLIEHQLAKLPGVIQINVDPQTGSTECTFHPNQVSQSDILQHIDSLGYSPHPLSEGAQHDAHQQEHARLLKQLAMAGLGMMQVSMFALGTYMDPVNAMDPAIERLLQGVSLLVATPVVFYSGASFLSGAWRAVKNLSLTMDVPVALALLLAYGASVANFFRGSGPTYFESVTMFVFLLLGARFIAMGVRHKALDAQNALLPMLPDSVLRVSSGKLVEVPCGDIQCGDLIRIRPGDRVAADGIIERGCSTLEEALITGECEPRTVGQGDTVLAGSGNFDGSVDLRVTRTGAECSLSQASALLHRARSERPQQVLIANTVSAWFIAAVLMIATATFILWWPAGFDTAFSCTLAVLVVTCPCALSLAIPAALSAATTRLARAGLLVSRLDALQVLPGVTCVLTDKTGTLSEGKPRITGTHLANNHPNPINEQQLMGSMAALEQHSKHPLAAAFKNTQPLGEAGDVTVQPGLGLSGTLNGRRLRLGNAAFVQASTDLGSPLILADHEGILGWAEVEDAWRADADSTLDQLKHSGLKRVIASGDSSARVAAAQQHFGIDQGFGDLSPEDKLALLAHLQRQGEVVLALGDGVNDSGLLGGADVSVAMAQGADLAKASADVVLAGEKLGAVLTLHSVARKTHHIIRQNLAWAALYNLLAVPFAAAGLIGPGLAALGMSISSLVVILNASRLSKDQAHHLTTKPSDASRPGSAALVPGTPR